MHTVVDIVYYYKESSTILYKKRKGGVKRLKSFGSVQEIVYRRILDLPISNRSEVEQRQ